MQPMDTASNADRLCDKNDHESADDVLELSDQRHPKQDFDINGT
jgi:hypothetical protein